IACCSGQRQISKTSCSISGPTSTTIAHIPHWKGERRIRRCHDQSQISARFDGNLTVVTYIRHQWLRNFPRLSIAAYPVNLGKTSKLPTKPSAVCVLGRRALRGSDRLSSTVSIRQK